MNIKSAGLFNLQVKCLSHFFFFYKCFYLILFYSGHCSFFLTYIKCLLSFRSVWGVFTNGDSLPRWHESQLHSRKVQLSSASGWNNAPFKDLLHRCHGNGLGLLAKPNMGDGDVPRAREVRHHLLTVPRRHRRTRQLHVHISSDQQNSFSSCSPATVFLDQQGGFIGSRYKKVVYRQFTNDKFTTQIERAADMEHLGIMGRPDRLYNSLHDTHF